MNEKIKKVAMAAVKKSAKALIPKYHKFNRHKVMLKKNYETLTESDILSQKIIINQIQNNFLGHNILSEEIGYLDNNSDYLWILDPIDGTTSFSMHSPLWSISLAVAKKKEEKMLAPDLIRPVVMERTEERKEWRVYELIIGVVYIPLLDELFVAEKNKGAFLNGRKLKVSDIKEGKTLNSYCHDHSPVEIKKMLKYFNYQKGRGTNIMQLGSSSIELCYIAAGRIESLVVFGANAWDVAAGILILKEAGGRVTNFSGQPWELWMRDIIASNGKVHNELLRIINQELKIK